MPGNLDGEFGSPPVYPSTSGGPSVLLRFLILVVIRLTADCGAQSNAVSRSLLHAKWFHQRISYLLSSSWRRCDGFARIQGVHVEGMLRAGQERIAETRATECQTLQATVPLLSRTKEGPLAVSSSLTAFASPAPRLTTFGRPAPLAATCASRLRNAAGV